MIYVCEFTRKDWQEELTRTALRAGLLDVSESEWIWQGNDRVIQHRREHLSAWLLFLYALRVEYGITELSSLKLAKYPHGKPYSIAYPELFFNLSHCQNACACVLADRPVGIDVERKLSYKEALMRRICTKEEQAIFAGCRDDAERAELLSVLWSMKESYVKRDGRGLSGGLNQVSCAAYLREYRSDRRRIQRQVQDTVQKKTSPEQDERQDCLTKRQSTGRAVMTLTVTGSGDADMAPTGITAASAPAMCISVHDAYTLAVCGCADTELVRISEDTLLSHHCPFRQVQ